MTSHVRSAALPPLTGSPWLTQGDYGDAGNLELVAPAADDGFWVFWFNADAVDHQQGAAMRCWSGGLHVFAGHRVQAARITQVRLGPRFLEALALSDGDLHRMYWTPDEGFVHAGVIATRIVDTSAVTEHGQTLRVAARRADGSGVLLIGDTRHYPDVTWSGSPDTAGEWSRRTVDLQLDDRGALHADGTPVADAGAHAVTACRTTLDGGRTDVVLAVGAGLLHLHGSGTTWSEPVPIESCVWVCDETPDAPIHRR